MVDDKMTPASSSLPHDLIVTEIFPRLRTASSVVSCAAVCKAWRRAITDPATSRLLRPRLDRFFPNLLLGFLYGGSNLGPWRQSQSVPEASVLARWVPQC
ncbi:hypothetical protein PR202_gb13726 [Eleusine coracana subsp. coracana]|uniref:F-box domain-containing protein n=1 Tax=Eleusine coracana subsp. coracana TaxID=191504 RepID=A0AAV5ETK1_ELECO|nr:hypothetical protein PR202_gb13726 [Eleusine coracana subsp. coracana]